MASRIKKLLYVIPYFVPAWSYGGPVKISYDFAKQLTSLGYKISVITTDVLDSQSRNKKLTEEIDGISVLRFKNINNKIARKFNFYTPIGAKKWLKKNINDFDLVHIHEFFTYQTLMACRISRQAGKPYLIQPHGSLSEFCRTSRFNLIKDRLIRMFAADVASASAIIALNEQEKKDILKIYPQIGSKIKIAPNGLDLSEFKKIKKINLHKIYNIPSQNSIIAFIGRLHFKKGLDISIKALSRLKDELDFTFLIIGPDEGEKDNLEKLAQNLGIKNRIIFAGLMSGKKKLETLKSADLSLLNSRSEGLPTTLLESAALGLPIVCSYESNFPEVKKFNAGFVVNGQKQTAQRIKQILEDSSLRKRLSKNALELSNSFEIKKLSQKLNGIYQSII